MESRKLIPQEIIRNYVDNFVKERRPQFLANNQIVDYFSGLTAYNLGDEGIEQLSQLLDRPVFVAGSNQLNHLVADILTGDIPKEDYFRLVYLSAKDERFSRIAANAITVLNYARVPFSGMNLSRIKIPDADLSRSLFHRTNLTNSDLRGVKFIDGFLGEANLTGSQMQDAVFGQFPFIKEYPNFTDIAFSPDEQWLAAANDNVTLFRLTKGNFEKITSEPKHGIKTPALVFSPNSKLLAFGDDKGWVKLWEVKTHTIFDVGKHKKEITSIAFNQTGNYLASASVDVRLWDANTKKLLTVLGRKFQTLFTHIVFNNQKQIIGYSLEGVVSVWSLNDYTLQTEFSFDMPENRMRIYERKVDSQLLHDTKKMSAPNSKNTVFSSDGKLLAVGGENRLDIWNLEEKVCSTELKLEGQHVTCLAMSRDAKLIAYAISEDYIIRLWDIGIQKPLTELRRHTNTINSLAFSSDNRQLISGGEERNLLVWDMSTSVLVGKSMDYPDGYATAIALLDNSRIALGYSDGKILVWNIHHKEFLYELKKHIGSIKCLVFNKKTKQLFSGDKQLTCVWNIETRTLVTKFNYDGSMLASNSNSQCLAVGTKGAALLFNLREVKLPPLRLETDNSFGISSSIVELKFNVDGKILAAVLDDSVSKKVKMWDVENISHLSLFDRSCIFYKPTPYIAFSPNNKWVSISCEKTIYLGDLSTKVFEKLEVNSEVESDVTCLAFSHNNKLLISGDKNGLLRLWHMKSQTLLVELNGHIGPTKSLAFSSDNRLLASVSFETICLWDVLKQKFLIKLEGHERDVKHVLFDETNQYLISQSSLDRSIKIWHLQNTVNGFEANLYFNTYPVLFGKSLDLKAVTGLSPDNKKLLSQVGAIRIKKNKPLSISPLYQSVNDLSLKKVKEPSLENQKKGSIVSKISQEEMFFITSVDSFIAQRKIQFLSNDEILDYLKADSRYQKTWISYLQVNPGLERLSHNPVLIIWLREYFSQQIALPIAEKIYEWLFERWFVYHQQALRNFGALKDYKGDFIEHCWVYSRAVALKLKEIEKDSIDFGDDSFGEEPIRLQWGRFFNKEGITCLIAQSCPWQVIGEQQLSLYHSSIIDYFVSQTQYDLKDHLGLPFIHGDEGVEHLSRLLDRPVFAAESNQLNHLVSDILTGDIPQEDYFRLAYLSAKDEKFARIAANAVTILNYANVSFSGIDLSYIKIPYADLSGAILSHTNLSYALLEGVNISKTFLEHTNLQNSNMRNIDFQLLPSLVLPSFIEDLKFSPNEELFIVGTGMGGANGHLMAWDTKTYKLKYMVINKLESVKNLVFNPAGNLIASSDGMVINLWDAYTGECLRRWSISKKQYHITGLAFNEDGSMLVVSNNSGEVPTQIWRLEDTTLYGSFPEQTQINAIAYSFDGKYFAAAGRHKIIYLREILKNTFKKLDGHLGEIACLAFSPINYILVSGSENNEVIIWDVLNGIILGRLTCVSYPKKIVFHPNGNYVAIGHDDFTVTIHSLDNTDSLIYEDATMSVSAITFKPNGEYLAIGAYQKIRFWKPNISKMKKRLYKNDGALTWDRLNLKTKEIVGNRTFIISLTTHNKNILEDMRKDVYGLLENINTHLEKMEKVHNKDKEICYIAFHPSDQYLAFTSNNHDDIYILDIKNRTILLILKTILNGELAFSKNGDWLVGGRSYQLIELWKVKLIGDNISVSNQKLINYRHSITSIAFSSDGIWLASSSHDTRIHLWNLEEQKMSIINGTERHISEIDFNEANQLIVLPHNQDGERQIWEYRQAGINKQWCLIWRNKNVFFSKNVCTINTEGIKEIEKKILKSGELDYLEKIGEIEEQLRNISIGPYKEDWPKHFLLCTTTLEPSKILYEKDYLYAISKQPKKIKLQKVPEPLLSILLLEIIKEIEHMIGVSPVSEGSYIKIARCYLILGKMEKNINFLEMARANFLLAYKVNFTGNVCAHLGNFFFHLKEWGQAIFYLEEALDCFDKRNIGQRETRTILFINAEKTYLDFSIANELDPEKGTLSIDSQFTTFFLLILAYMYKDKFIPRKVLVRFKDFLEIYKLTVSDSNILNSVISRIMLLHDLLGIAIDEGFSDFETFFKKKSAVPPLQFLFEILKPVGSFVWSSQQRSSSLLPTTVKSYLQSKDNIKLYGTPFWRDLKTQKLLLAKLPGTRQEIYFQKETVCGGSSGIPALGTDRKEFVETLLSLKNDFESRESLWQEIYQAFISNSIPQAEKWQMLFAKKTQIYLEWYDILLTLKEEIENAEEFDRDQIEGLINFLIEKGHAEWAEKLRKKNSEVLQIEEALRLYCASEEVYEQYVQLFHSEQERLWIGYSSAVLFAKVKEISLYIWESEEDNTSKLKLKNYFVTDRPCNVIHLYCPSCSNCFALLITDKRNELLQESQPELEVSTMDLLPKTINFF